MLNLKQSKSVRKSVASEHQLNLWCPEGDYFAKTTTTMLRKGRLRCPKHNTVLKTREERGENRGRHAA